MRFGTHLSTLAVLAIPLLFCSCITTVGHKMNLQEIASLTLNEPMTKADAYRRFGSPREEGVSTNGFLGLRYFHLFKNFDSPARLRLLQIETKNDRLNSFIYLSSYPEDATKARWIHLNSIKKGITKDDILSLLGKPCGRSLCPSKMDEFEGICDKGTEIWYWGELSEDQAYQVLVAFDAEGKVSEVLSKEFTP